MDLPPHLRRPPGRAAHRAGTGWLGLTLGLALTACASVPKGQYGIDSVEVMGAEAMAEGAIKRCLLTVERSTVGITLGVASAECTEPPFDRAAPRLALWSWPWTDWSGLNAAVLDLDKQRVERFYQARGFYDARVLELRFDPPVAGDPTAPLPSGACNPELEECTVKVVIVVDEGLPLLVSDVHVEGAQAVDSLGRELLADAELPIVGERFDEFDHDRAKHALADQLAEAGYPAAKVEGRVVLDHQRKRASVTYRVTPGPLYSFGQVRVEGQRELPAAPVIGAAGVVRGERFRQSALREVQGHVYALAAFSSVEVERELDTQRHEVNVRVKVTPLPYDAFRLGIGVTSGALQRTDTGAVESVPQWDMHLFARYERRHILGTLGKLRIEDRPRLIFQRPFPQPEEPQPGNTLRLRVSEPGLIEARTELVAESLWDYGPDPYLGFLRSDVALRLSGNRPFLRRTLFATLAVEHDRFLVADDTQTSDGSELPSSYQYSFLEQQITLDLRDDQVQPRSGLQLLLTTAQSVHTPVSDWTLLRVLPDARAYLPLPFSMVLALRFAVGAIFVEDAGGELDDPSKTLGPAAYRLRGGGANGNRGFVAGELGAGAEGGRRRWESSAELRVRMGNAFGVVLFFDMGDVSQGTRFRFDEPNPSTGFGFRYLTPFGAIRTDVGFRLEPVPDESAAGTLFGAHGALHLTLGEAF